MAPATAREQATAAPAYAPRESEVRVLLRILSTQAANSNPIVAVTAIVMVATMYHKVETTGLLVWAALAVLVAVSRRMISTHVRRNLAQASEAQLSGALRVTVWGSACNSVVMGSAFWLIAATGDMYVRLVITLISMAHMMAVMLYLLPGLAPRLIASVGNVAQGLLFWMGIGIAEPARWEVVLVYGGLFWCGLVVGREQLRQFRESMRMRDENAALLARLEQERTVVQAALEEARLANAAKNRFLAAASHDLRQPLHALTMFLGTLGFHVAGTEGRRLLGRANDTVRALDEQFNSLLDLSRFDAGAVSAKPATFRLDELLSRIVDEFRPQAEHKGLGLAVSTVPAPVFTDPVLLGRLLRNLLDNAIHYTARGTVAARIEAAAGGFQLVIRDTGPGIPDHLQATVFDEYVQLDNPGRQRERGVGLGLAIVKRVEQLLGLQLQLHSVPGQGCTFSMNVPAAADDAPAAPPPRGQDPLAWRTNARIWILDDDETVLEGLQGQLRAWGARVTTFPDPGQLLESLATAVPKPDWILTDDMLGARLSGLEVAEAVARQFAAVRVGLITGNTEPARLEQLRASGLPVIVKPATPELLMNLLADGTAGSVAASTAA